MKERIRVIARLDIKGKNVVKGVHFEGLRIVGIPNDLALKYCEEGIDEIVYIDSVASLYRRNNLSNIVEQTVKNTTVPITVGGGIRTIEDITQILRSGADKIAINTEATRNPSFLEEAARKFGSQCVILSIPAKKIAHNKWVVYTDNARERTEIDAIEWAKKAEERGVGEVLLSSIDCEGTMKGLDIDLYSEISSEVNIPVIACGGASSASDISNLFSNTEVDAVAIASILHYNHVNIAEIKDELKISGYNVRLSNETTDISLKKNKTHPKIGIIDCGCGNLYNLQSCFQKIGFVPEIITKPEQICSVEKLVLPGVGSFGGAMAQLNEYNVTELIKEFARSGKQILGICLGAQLLLSHSEEFGMTEGLDLIPGSVIPIERNGQFPVRVPHVGWASIAPVCSDDMASNKWQNGILQGVEFGFEAYFTHSFKIEPIEKSDVIAWCFYGGQKICATVKRNNVIGCQFHPERSGKTGLNIIYNFCRELPLQ